MISLILAVLGFAVWMVVSELQHAAARRWAELAAGLGGTHQIGRRGLWRRAHHILAQPGGQPLLVARDPGRTDGASTRLVLAAPGLAEACLVLARERDLAWWTQFRMVEMRVGDEVFDARFKLMSDAPARVRLWLDLEVRRALRVLYGWKLVVGGREIVLEHEDNPPSLEAVRAAAQAAMLLADSENRWRQRWHDVAPFLDVRDSIDPISTYFEDSLRWGVLTINVQHGPPALGSADRKSVV